MPDKDDILTSHSLKSEVYARYSSEIERDRTASSEFSKLANQSAYLLNGGALLAVPTYVGALQQPVAAVSTAISYAFFCFACGTVLAALCSYLTYFNYDTHGSAVEIERDMTIVTIDQEFDTTSYFLTHGSREEYFDNIEKDSDRLNSITNYTFWFAHVAGVGSYILFGAGCWFAKGAMLV